jgi:UDP-MurNAc hydroxylase
MINQLTFVNHASFYIANGNSLLLVDPWVEGTVFNNGWRLLDTTTSNAALVHEIAAHKLNTFIWYSHEHPDHFSVSFIKKLKQDFPGKVTILFQQTKDQRVLGFLKKNGFDVIDCAPGATVTLDKTLSITVYPFSDGDSYCLIQSGQRFILNINDCPLLTQTMCRAVRTQIAPVTDKIDLLFTQFGYANWVGNPFEPGLRRRAAAEKRERISLQMRAFAPSLTIPFASFVSFCSIENSYLNDYQNSAYTIRQWSTLSPETENLRFMKPGDTIDLNKVTPGSMMRMSQAAVAHWEQLGSSSRAVLPPEPPASIAALQAAFTRYRNIIRSQLPVLPYLLERLGLIKPLRIHFPDLRLTVRFSYVHGYTALSGGSAFDISMSSSSAVFIFTNEYGFNTTHVNGRFRTTGAQSLGRFSRFFMPQNLVRQGYGIAHPFATASHLAGNLLGRLRTGA